MSDEIGSTMIEPYWSDGKRTIYLGDCREILPELELVDLLLTDPCYGVRADRDRHSQASGWIDYGSTGWDNERTPYPLIEACIAKADRAIIWGGNFWPLPVRGGWLVWYKMQTNFSLSDGELAWTSENRALRVFPYSRAAALQDGKQHPTQKPLALIRWCIKQMEPCGPILDPFMGSGTTLRAAKDNELIAIGIDREERYCEVAANRLLQSSLFDDLPEPDAPDISPHLVMEGMNE